MSLEQEDAGKKKVLEYVRRKAPGAVASFGPVTDCLYPLTIVIGTTSPSPLWIHEDTLADLAGGRWAYVQTLIDEKLASAKPGVGA